MPRYRTRPTEVTAIRWEGGNYKEMLGFAQTAVTVQPDGAAMFMTGAGSMWVPLGSWLVRDQARGLAVMADGEFIAAYQAGDAV